MAFYASLGEWSKWAWVLLANHLWQATLFFLFVLLISLSLKRSPARVRYSLWLVALTKFVLPCAAIISLINYAGVDAVSLFSSEGGREASGMAISPFLSPVTNPPVALHAIESPKPGLGSSAISYAATIQEQSNWYGVLTLVWLMGCAMLFCLWLRKRGLLAAVIRSGKVVRSGREFETLQRVRSWLGLRRSITLVISAKIDEPGVWRVLRPMIVLPEGISDRLSDDELETILMHELVHVERWDNLTGIIQRIVCCLLWFHPLVWLLDRQLLAEREQSCDDTVIKLSGASEIYASSIRKICRHSIGWELTGLSSAAGSDLKKRIRRIVAADMTRSPSLLHRMLLVVVVCVLLILSAAAGRIDGEAVIARSNTYDLSAVDARFVLDSKEDKGKADINAEVGASKLAPQQPTTDLLQTKNFSEAPVEIRGQSEQIEIASSRIIAEVSPPRSQDAIPQERIAGTGATLAASIIPASAAHVDSSEFAGRYEVDPAAAENFVLDITLEHGELWLKPSHAPKRMLMRTSELNLADVYSDFRLSGIQDNRGRILGLRLDSWNRAVTARKLALPQPSLKGNTTFKLSGYANARIVAVAGSFNNWNQSQFLFSRVDGEWICKLNLPPGKYEYKFIVDGNWLVDPRNPTIAHDERGNANSVLVSE
jgi:beta-lactamase regulating signal transducer with metallopeptidase domain